MASNGARDPHRVPCDSLGFFTLSLHPLRRVPWSGDLNDGTELEIVTRISRILDSPATGVLIRSLE
jgi:hypothetical protein